MIPTLTTDRLILRAPNKNDVEAWTKFLGSERSKFVGGPGLDAGKSWRALASILGHWALRGDGSWTFADKKTDRGIGLTGPWHPAGWPEKELGWSIWSQQDQGKGYAFEAASAARDFVFKSFKWATAVSYIDPANGASIALAQRLGAVLDGNAATPDNNSCLVYRHPNPGAS